MLTFLGIIFTTKLIQPLFLVRNYWNLEFLMFQCIFHLGHQYLLSYEYSNVILIVCMFCKQINTLFYLKFREIFLYRRTVLRLHGMKSAEKLFFFQIYPMIDKYISLYLRFFLNPRWSLILPLKIEKTCNQVKWIC